MKLRLKDLSADLLTDRGVFSYRRIDPGTKLLLERGPRPPGAGVGGVEPVDGGEGVKGGEGIEPGVDGVGGGEGDEGVGGVEGVEGSEGGEGGSPTLLDLGCGYGPIALVLARRSPASEVWAVDVNGRARELTGINTRAYAERVRVAAPEEVPDAVRFDAVYCNPPVRIGKEALGALLLRWLTRLKEGGFGALSVHKNLGGASLERWLTEQGWNVRTHARQAGYRVLQVDASRRRC